MRSLERNKRTLHYALFINDEPIVDEYGNETGERKPTYGDITELRCNVSAAVGAEVVQAFGSFTNYTRVVCVSDDTLPIAEQTIVWFGVPMTEPYNYVVTRKADSKNGTLYALQEVKVRT